MRISALLFAGILLLAGAAAAGADTVHLKNGNLVQGKIIEKTADSVKIDVSGVTLTYYTDEVDTVETSEQPAQPLAVPVAAAVVAQPEAAAPIVAAVVQAVPVPAAQPEAPAPAPVAAQPAAVTLPQPELPAPVALKDEAPAATDELSGMSKQELILKFIDIYGVKQNMQANFDQMVETLTPDQAKAFRESVKVDEIVKELLPIYDKHFTADNLRAYIRFYSSSEGKKLVQTLPLLMKDSVDISMKYLDAHLPESLKQEQAPAAGN